MSGRSPYTPYGSAGDSYYERTSLRRSRNHHDDDDNTNNTINRNRQQVGRDWRSIQQSARNSSGQVFAVNIPQQSQQYQQSAAPQQTTTAVVATSSTSATSSSSAPPTSLSGTIVNALTPFDTNTGAIDLRIVSEYANSIKQDGAKGVLIGTPFTGEGLTLSTSEQESLITAWCQHRNNLAVGVWINASGPAGATLAQAAQRSGAACIVIGTANSEEASATDAARFIATTLRGASNSIPFLVSIPSSLVGYAADEFISAVSRLDGFRGVVATRLCHVVAAANTGKCGSLLFSAINGDDDLQCISAAAEGATGVISDHSSVVAPLLNRIFAAGAKGDAATATKMGKLFAQYIAGFPARRALQVAALKSLLALRLDLPASAVEVRAPTPTLSAADAARLRQRMEQFIKAYASAVGGSAAPSSASAPAAAKTTVDVMSMPGYRGQLNDLIIRRIEACERLCNKSGMINKFPHLQYPDGRWRTRRAGPSPAQYIDHTLLKAEAKEEEVVKLVNEAKANNFFAVCVNGSRAARCVEMCRGTSVNVAAVIGFPLGAGTIRAKAEEAGELVHEVGVQEIDMVMNIGAFKDKNYRHVYEDIKAVVKASAPAIVKVIFETCLLNQEEIIDASVLSVFAGAQFIKTSTGFNKGGATPDAIDVMLAVGGNEADVKASGGVRDFATAMAYINAGVMRIGTSSGVAIIAGKPAGAGY